MNFNIVEGKDDSITEKFIDLYYDRSLNKAQICRKLDISGGKYLRIKNELVEKGKIDGEFRNRSNKANAKYYFKDKKRKAYTVCRVLRGKQTYFITVSSEEKAKFCVDLFHRYGWTKGSIPFVRAKVLEVFGE